MSTQTERPADQAGPHTLASTVVSSPEPLAGGVWTEEELQRAVPEPPPQPSRRPTLSDGPSPETHWPVTYVPPSIAGSPYDAICKIFYRRRGVPYVASGWIAEGNNGRKGVLTSGHVVYQNGAWSQDYLVCRQYSAGHAAERFTGRFARTLHGWIHGHGAREFWDLGAIIPDHPIPEATPALPVVFAYPPDQGPFNFFTDPGYPAKPANGYPFDGQLLWESVGPLIQAHWAGDQCVLEAYNAMEQGSSGSPWLIRDPIRHQFHAAGMQSSGWDGVPSSYSPYFDRRNLIPLLRDIGLWNDAPAERTAA